MKFQTITTLALVVGVAYAQNGAEGKTTIGDTPATQGSETGVDNPDSVSGARGVHPSSDSSMMSGSAMNATSMMSMTGESMTMMPSSTVGVSGQSVGTSGATAAAASTSKSAAVRGYDGLAGRMGVFCGVAVCVITGVLALV
jgi:hypothetical protein